jgi:hypothetical protein
MNGAVRSFVQRGAGGVKRHPTLQAASRRRNDYKRFGKIERKIIYSSVIVKVVIGDV